jgi:hypothetical protein
MGSEPSETGSALTVILADYQGRPIRLTAERLEHVRKHPEMGGQEEKIAQTLSQPDTVIIGELDESVWHYHRLYERTPVTKKYLLVAVKYLGNDAFVITAFFTDRIKRGKVKWTKSESGLTEKGTT